MWLSLLIRVMRWYARSNVRFAVPASFTFWKMSAQTAVGIFVVGLFARDVIGNPVIILENTRQAPPLSIVLCIRLITGSSLKRFSLFLRNCDESRALNQMSDENFLNLRGG